MKCCYGYLSWGEVQIACIRSSWCHRRPKTPSSLASFKSRLVLPFWYRLTQVVPEKRPLNGCSSVVHTFHIANVRIVYTAVVAQSRAVHQPTSARSCGKASIVLSIIGIALGVLSIILSIVLSLVGVGVATTHAAQIHQTQVKVSRLIVRPHCTHAGPRCGLFTFSCID